MKRLCAVWAMAMLSCGCALAEDVPSVALTREEVQLLVRISELSEWIGTPVALSTGLCVQRNYAGTWPQSGLGDLPMRAETMLQRAWETCSTVGEGLRLVKQAREIFQSQILRLTQPHAALSQCKKELMRAANFQSCVISAVGRPLNEEERRALVKTVQRQ